MTPPLHVEITNPNHARIIGFTADYLGKSNAEVLVDLVELSQIFLALLADPLGKGADALQMLRDRVAEDPGMSAYVEIFTKLWEAGKERPDGG